MATDGKTQGKGKQVRRVLGAIGGLAIGGAIGYGTARFLDLRIPDDAGPLEFVMGYALVIGLFALVALLQIVIHEGGHLLAGLATGYEFCSFRVGSFMLVRRNGRLTLKRFSLAGTGGQCLMAPPALRDGHYPYVFYNAGGVLANLCTALVCGLLWLALYRNGDRTATGSLFLLAMVIVGVAYALLNGVPNGSGPVPNDGWNVLHLGADPLALHSLWLQLTVNAQLSRGTRLKDMPEAWFVNPTDDQLSNGMATSLGVFCENRLMDAHRFAEAREQAERLLAPTAATLAIYRHMLTCDVLTCDVLLGNRDPEASVLEERGVKATLKAMRDNPSVLRTRYAMARHLGNDAEANKILQRFDQVARTYPYEADIASERELLALL